MTKFRVAALTLIFLIVATILSPKPLSASGSYQEGYPPPVEEIPLPGAGQDVPLTVTVQPYPGGGTDFGNSSPVPIGIESGALTGESNTSGMADSVGQVNAGTDSRGLIFLWLGFLATFLVFLTSIVGSIILFTRRNDS